MTRCICSTDSAMTSSVLRFITRFFYVVRATIHNGSQCISDATNPVLCQFNLYLLMYLIKGILYQDNAVLTVLTVFHAVCILTVHRNFITIFFLLKRPTLPHFGNSRSFKTAARTSSSPFIADFFSCAC